MLGNIYIHVILIQKTTQLKNMLNSKELEFIMEAHNGLSARIVEEAGGYSISHKINHF